MLNTLFFALCLFAPQDTPKTPEQLLVEMDADDLDSRLEAEKALEKLAVADKSMLEWLRKECGRPHAARFIERLKEILRNGDAAWSAKSLRVVDRGTLARHGGGPSNSMALSPDGKTIVSSGSDGRAHFLEAGTLREIRVVEASGAFRFSPDGKRLAAVSPKGVRILDAANGTPLSEFAPPEEAFVACLSSDFSTLFTAGKDIVEWDIAKKEVRHRTDPPGDEAWAGRDRITDLVIAPDGSLLIDSTFGVLYRWVPGDAGCSLVTKAFRSSSSGRRGLTLAGSSILQVRQKVIALFDIAGAVVRQDESAQDMDGAVVSPSGRYAAVKCGDGLVVYSLKDLSVVGRLPSNWGASIFLDDRFVVTTQAKELRKIEFTTGTVAARAAVHPGWVWAQTLFPDGKSILTYGTDLKFRLWDAATGRETGAFDSDLLEGGHWPLQISPNGRWLAASNFGGPLRIYDLAERKLVHRIAKEVRLQPLEDWMTSIFDISFIDDNRVVVSWGDNDIVVYDPETGRALQTFEARSRGRNHISPDGLTAWRQIYGANSQSSLEFIDVVGGKVTPAGKPETGELSAVTRNAGIWFESDQFGKGCVMRVEGCDQKETGRREFKEHLRAMAVDRAGRRIALPTSNAILVLDAETLKEIARIEGSGRDVVFSADGRFLSFVADRAVRVVELVKAD